MKKLIAALVLIFVIITAVSCIAVNKKTVSAQNQLEKSIMVYTTHSNEQMQYIANEFKKTTGITVNYKIVNNLTQAVEDAKNSGANVDVIYGGNQVEFDNLASKGMLEEVPVSFSNDINAQHKNADGYWYGTSISPLVMYYNTAYMLPQDAPTEWYQLGLPKYYDRMVLPNIDTATTESLLTALSYKYSKSQVATEYATFIQGLRDNVLAYAQNTDAAMSLMKTNKEAALSVGELSQVNTAIAQGAPFKVINATDGSPMVVQGVGVLKGCQNINSAKLFVEFVAGQNMQLQLAEKFSQIPTMSSILPYAPKWMSDPDALNIANIDWNSIAPNSTQLIAKFNSLVKSPKQDAIKLTAPIIADSLIASQEKLVSKAVPNPKDETLAQKQAAEAKVKEQAQQAVDKAKAAQKSAQDKQQQTQAQQSAMQSLQNLGETAM